MEKKYIAGLALLVAANGLYAGSVTVGTGAKDDQGNYYGFTLALGTNTAALTDPDGILEGLSGETVTLDNVNLLTRSGGILSDAKLAVYAFAGDGNVGNFVGLSEVTAFTPDTDVAFSFNNLNLTVGERYQFLFVNSGATTESLSGTGFEPLLSLYQPYSLAWGISVTAEQYAGALLPSGWGIYTSNGLNSWEGHRMPVVSLTVSSVAIPEPSAFALVAGVGSLFFAYTFRRRKTPSIRRSA